MRKVFALAAAGMLLAGCTITRNNFVPPPSETAPTAIRLANTSVYVYCFLDARVSNIGHAMLARFDDLLIQRLNAEHIATAAYHYPVPAGAYDRARVNEPIAVLETIAAHADAEKAAHAQYRLVIFPSESVGQSIDLANSVRVYILRWDLYDIATGKLLWTTQSVGSQANLLFASETDPSVRATLIVDGFVAELKKAGLL